VQARHWATCTSPATHPTTKTKSWRDPDRVGAISLLVEFSAFGLTHAKDLDALSALNAPPRQPWGASIREEKHLTDTVAIDISLSRPRPVDSCIC
jgi:hypothetical protein